MLFPFVFYSLLVVMLRSCDGKCNNKNMNNSNKINTHCTLIDAVPNYLPFTCVQKEKNFADDKKRMKIFALLFCDAITNWCNKIASIFNSWYFIIIFCFDTFWFCGTIKKSSNTMLWARKRKKNGKIHPFKKETLLLSKTVSDCAKKKKYCQRT